MASGTSSEVVLLPIQPRYARQIMSGDKKVEFRKTVFKTPPRFVIVYASSPVKKVVGYFRVSGVRVDGIEALWERYAHVGGIEREYFAAYYAAREKGLALEVGDVVALEKPLPLDALGLDTRPPQSFSYVAQDIVDRLDELVPAKAS